MKKRVTQFELHTALPKPNREIPGYEWDDVDTSKSRILGTGSFSCVHSVGLLNQPGKVFALKQLNVSTSSKTVKQYKRGAIDIALEGKLISYLDHENIIKLHGTKKGCIRDSINSTDEPFFLVLDYLSETLVDKLEQWKREDNAIYKLKSRVFGQNDKLVSRIESAALGVAKGMMYLHDHQVIFRDLKPDNIGFDSDGTVKIFDFGVARDLEYVKKVGDCLGFTGTPRYMATEVVSGKKYGLPADVYSFGILLHQICTLKQPYARLRDIDAFRSNVVLGGSRPKLSLIKYPEIRALIEKCWDSDPKKRPSFAAIVLILESFVESFRCGVGSSQKRSYKKIIERNIGKQMGKQLEPPTVAEKNFSDLSDLQSSLAATNVSSSSLLYARQSTVGQK